MSMPHSEGMNDKENKIKYTKDFWQTYSKEQVLSDADAIEILDNTRALISFLNRIAEKKEKTIGGETSMG